MRCCFWCERYIRYKKESFCLVKIWISDPDSYEYEKINLRFFCKRGPVRILQIIGRLKTKCVIERYIGLSDPERNEQEE